MDNILSRNDIGKAIRKLGTVVAIIGIGSAIGGVWYFYKNNIWRPKVTLNGINWQEGEALLILNGRRKILYGDTELSASGEWGLRFSKAPDQQDAGYHRIELVKDGKVYSILATRTLDEQTATVEEPGDELPEPIS